MNELHLFAGAGGGILGGMLLGHTCVCAVEIEPYCQQVLLQRQRDGILPKFPIWDDVRTFDGKPWSGFVDIVCGGFPCQDISAAGKGAGIRGKRSGLWKEFARIISQIRPDYVFLENSPMLTIRGAVRVVGDLAKMGYVGSNGVLGAEDAIWNLGDPCADHERKRIWFCGKNSNSDRFRKLQSERSQQDKRERVCDSCQTIPNTTIKGLEGISREGLHGTRRASIKPAGNSWWSSEPGICRVANGVAHRLDRLKAVGNGQVPAVVKLAWRILTNEQP